MMRANVERIYDGYERKAAEAIMIANAVNSSKKIGASDLFKRPVDEYTAKNRTEDLLDKAEQASEWLSQFEQFNTGRKEDAHG